MILFSALYGRVSGVVTIEGAYLVFKSDVDGSQVRIGLSSLDVSLEGLNSHHYYFFDRFRPSDRICVQDDGILKVLAAKDLPAVDEVLQKAKYRKLKRHVLLGMPVAMIAASFIVVPVALSFVPVAWMSNILSPKQEKVLGRWMLPLIKAQYGIQEQHPARHLVVKLIDQLKAADAELESLEIDVYVSTSSEVNAFAAPGNIIVINRGLVEKADSIEEVMGVLAHELGHIQQRHVVKSLVGGFGSIFGTIFLSTLVGYDGAAAIAKTTSFLTLKYSRDDELAADRRGFEFLRQAKISPSGMISFFQKLSEHQLAMPSILSFVSTHPASVDRAQALSLMVKEEPESESAKPAVDLQQLKDAF